MIDDDEDDDDDDDDDDFSFCGDPSCAVDRTLESIF